MLCTLAAPKRLRTILGQRDRGNSSACCRTNSWIKSPIKKRQQELHRVLKTNGVLVVKAPAKYNRFDKDVGHITFFSPTELRNFVESFVRQPYEPQPFLGTSRLGRLAMRMISSVLKPDKWAATISLVAEKGPRS